MKSSRRHNLVAALLALFSMLFMQHAVATYACPAWEQGMAGQSAMATSMDSLDMADCAGTDPEQPNLCHAYENQHRQSLDKPDIPGIQPFSAAKVVLYATPLILVTSPVPSLLDTDSLTRITSPPLAIRHCCFRI